MGIKVLPKINAQAIAGNKPFHVTVMPNPGVQDFKVMVNAATAEPVLTRLMDTSGKELKRMKGIPGSLTTFGSYLNSGIYFLEIIRSKNKKLEKLIKL